MRSLTWALPVLLAIGLATPAQAAQPPTREKSGFIVQDGTLVWRAPKPLPIGDAAVEFWDGDRLLGRPRASFDHRTFTLDDTTVANPQAPQVRVGGKRVDVEEKPRPRALAPMQAPAAPLPAAQVDPGTPGPFKTTSGEYTLDPVTLPNYPTSVEMQALVVAPVNAPGKRLLALFLHGRHGTCYIPGGAEGLSWPCPQGMKPTPSHKGYQQAQQLLASQGYVTVSISANSINAQDGGIMDAGSQGRSSLVRQHLSRWADWADTGRGSAPEIVKAAPVADLSNVLLMGHSRGGEGVNRSAVDSLSPPPGENLPTRWNIRGLVLIGPTAFGQNPAADVHAVTFLPGCDGDVSDLQGQEYADASRGVSRGKALHSSLYFAGANHNFFNTEWTPGQAEAPAYDDFPGGDAVCSEGTPTRLTPAQQQTAGATYIAAAARLFIGGDQRVLPLVDGTGVRAPSADPARVISQAVGGARVPFVVPENTTQVSGGAKLCKLVTMGADSCFDPAIAQFEPHSTRLQGSVSEDPDRVAVTLAGSGAVRPANTVSLAGSRNLALRLIVPPNTKDNQFAVAITDSNGRKAQLGTVKLDGLTATEKMVSLWAQEVRVPLPVYGIDLRQVASLEIVPSGTGQAWLMDAYGWNTGLPEPEPVALSRVDVSDLFVPEGDSGTRTFQVKVTASGNTAGTARLFVSDGAGGYTTRVITVQPGQQTVDVPFAITGDTKWDPFSIRRSVFAKALHGVVAADYAGGLIVQNDDPEPAITVTPITDKVTEGGTLAWRVTLAAPMDFLYAQRVQVVAPASGTELSSTDVSTEWFAQWSGQNPQPSRPLSGTDPHPHRAADRGLHHPDCRGQCR
ncbi:hypothetical protein LWC34_22805 [Kibdelosporangium philippinense]|uniref:Secreted protein n=1 Tax=Kibdelosporangium philippinense TaxID=211113 RepID=A0ABS8ZFE7_9PSEU|nr:hypothetical protein [Kibdelosporangium philippinense]MCE7005635.1 hypothetical protein [Kibdelosporangium philippinense]